MIGLVVIKKNLLVFNFRGFFNCFGCPSIEWSRLVGKYHASLLKEDGYVPSMFCMSGDRCEQASDRDVYSRGSNIYGSRRRGMSIVIRTRSVMWVLLLHNKTNEFRMPILFVIYTNTYNIYTHQKQYRNTLLLAFLFYRWWLCFARYVWVSLVCLCCRVEIWYRRLVNGVATGSCVVHSSLN